ncbi:hypothetical protein ACFY4C_20305 [Actinomadura viridis]|uniref:hypothetical protein n=1 Tax=Actinomadura viridis TaxID=58110 RepID=UPI00369B62A7
MAEPMSDERLVEIQAEYDEFPTTEVADLLAEVKRLRDLRIKDMHWEAHLGEALWTGQGSIAELAEQVTKLRTEVARWQERDSQTAALLKHVEAEQDRARAVAAAAEATLGEQIDRAITADDQRNAAWTRIAELRAQIVALGKQMEDHDRLAEQVKHTRALLPEIDATFRRLCVQVGIESQEALAEIYGALKHNLGVEDSDECTSCGTETTDLYVDPSPRPSEARP